MGQLFYVGYGRLGSRAMHRAGELVRTGAIGRPVQTIGLGPHRINSPTRPPWFYQRARYGGIITDLGSHLVEQFLFFTVSAAIPDERAAIGLQAMRHGKDFLTDKPGFTTLDQIAEAQRAHAETGRLGLGPHLRE